MLHGEKVGIMQAIEITIMLAIGITLIYFNLAADSDYDVRRVISPSAINGERSALIALLAIGAGFYSLRHNPAWEGMPKISLLG